jgi:uncharacterized protein YjeT (DUF2065 family)
MELATAFKVIGWLWVGAQLCSHPRLWKRARQALRSGVLNILRRVT